MKFTIHRLSALITISWHLVLKKEDNLPIHGITAHYSLALIFVKEIINVLSNSFFFIND